MSDILLKSMHFPSLDSRYIVGDDSMSVEGAAADAKATGDALALKADKTDTYTKAQVDTKVGDAKTELETAIEDLEENKLAIDGYSELATVGNAEQLVATQHITDTEPYNFRKTGGPNDVGDRVYDTLVGGSVVWNQLVDSGTTEVTVPNGHKYYANINGTKSIGASTGTAISINDSTKDNVIDLTAALGSTIADYVYSLETATAGAGVAWVRKYFPGVYYGYSEPHFEHVQVSAKNTVGFNALDIASSYGSTSFDLSGTKLTNKLADGRTFLQVTVQLYNGNTFVKNLYGAGKTGTGRATSVFNTGDDSRANILVIKHGGTTQDLTLAIIPYDSVLKNTDYCLSLTIEKNNPTVVGGLVLDEICLNIHGDRDGEYEAYKKRTYPLDSSLTLRGIPKLDSANRLYFDGDIYRHDGSGERRYSEKVLTASDIRSNLTTYENVVYARIAKPNTADIASVANIVGYPYSDYNGNWNVAANIGLCFTKADIQNWWVGFAPGTTIEQATNALVGKTMVYELKTPEPFTAEPFQAPMVVDPLGTEEFVDYAVEQGERDVAIPVGHSSEYPADLRGKLQHLPSLSTSGDGRYVVVQTGNQMTLSPDTSLGLIAALEARVAALEGGNG